MWARHKVHKDNFKRGKRDNDSANEKSNEQTKSTLKKVSFTSVKDNEENGDHSDELEIKVKEELLQNTKSFLSQYTDFQTGGVHGA